MPASAMMRLLMRLLPLLTVGGLLLPGFLGQAQPPVTSLPPAGQASVSAPLSAPPAVPPSAGVPLHPVTTQTVVQALLIFGLFIILAVGIATRKVPAMVALPLMALGIGLIAGAPLFGETGVLSAVIEGRTPPDVSAPTGSFKLYQAIIWIMIGGMFARFIADARIAERIVKYAAEYGGENPFSIALVMSAITVLIFTATGGLPMIIMLGTVMFPILLSLGVPAAVCGALLLLAFPIGVSLQPGEWGKIAQIYDVPFTTVRNYFLIWASIQAVILVLFLSVEFLRMKRTTVTVTGILGSLGRIAVVLALVAFVMFFEYTAALLPDSYAPAIERVVGWRSDAFQLLQWFVIALLILAVVHTQYQHLVKKRVTAQWSLLTPVLPLIFLLVLEFGSAIVPAFLGALAFGYFTTPQERGMQKLGRSIINGVSDVAAPVVLMIGIGMLLAVATLPQVDAILTPILRQAIPTGPRSYILTFLLASPLALYRGPLNQYGLGLGVATLMKGPGMLPAPAVMGAMNSVGMLQDPTTTQNVWICGYLKLDINALLFKLFFYSILLMVAGLTLSAILFFPDGLQQLLGLGN